MSETAEVKTFIKTGENMFKLATAPRHVFGEAHRVPPGLSRSRLAQHERTCKACGAVKVTVIRGDGQAWREWRLSEDGAQMEMADPPCRIPEDKP